MSEWEERLNGILSDPQQMERIAAMAQSLMGAQEPTKGTEKPTRGLAEGIDPMALGRIAGALGGRTDHKHALLQAMKPYLSSKRQEKLDRAVKLAKMIHMAELVFGNLWEDSDATI